MPWEYLENPELDCRLFVISGFLAQKIDGKHIVDLNCGAARILKFLPKTYASYFGNDIDSKYIHDASKKWGADNVTLCTMNDEKAVESLRERPVDILLILGHGAGHIKKNSWESTTQTKSFLEIVEQHSPEILILEASNEYETLYRPLQEIAEHLSNKYHIVHKIEILDCTKQVRFNSQNTARFIKLLGFIKKMKEKFLIPTKNRFSKRVLVILERV